MRWYTRKSPTKCLLHPRYTTELLKSDAPGNALVIGFTEIGLWGAMDEKTERVFKAGTLAIVEAAEEHGNYPVKDL